MRIECPLCGGRDAREFSVLGARDLMDRPDSAAPEQAFFDYLHIRANPAGRHCEMWHHVMGCRAWLVVERHTVTHEVLGVKLARDVAGDGS